VVSQDVHCNRNRHHSAGQSPSGLVMSSASMSLSHGSPLSINGSDLLVPKKNNKHRSAGCFSSTVAVNKPQQTSRR
jgi:hypothetical protein